MVVCCILLLMLREQQFIAGSQSLMVTTSPSWFADTKTDELELRHLCDHLLCRPGLEHGVRHSVYRWWW
ncbi:hypothetical protein DPMN_077739 [Dreissena polymorpha]|uniref:Secreted protein n=1 Tax=Dreissena polymorpha TaxID=45954 RepID=A0A9D3YPD5_DREPO|nr:hypothetical protein DPMN_077739 [Dreissena polymorpha]